MVATTQAAPDLVWRAQQGRAGELWLVPSFLALALVAGGGGSPAPLPELLLELVATAIFVAWLSPLFTNDDGSLPPRVGWLAVAVIALAVVLPVLQLIPLPRNVWSQFSGRQSEIAALQLIGADRESRPWSIAPSVTLNSLVSLGPPLLLLAMTASAGPRAIRVSLWALMVVELCAACVGALQLSSAGANFHLYSETHTGWITGFHANRNAAADAFLIAMLACSALVAMERPAGGGATRRSAAIRYKRIVTSLVVANAIFLAATVLTGSRTGIALLVLVLVFQAAIVLPLFGRLSRRLLLGIAAALALLALGALAMAYFNPVFGRVLTRFAGSGGEGRVQLWEDTRFAIAQYWPFGSGLGTFVDAILPVERLEVLESAVPNRAHNDYLEFALEGGVFAIVFGILTLLLLLYGFFRRFRGGNRESALAALGALGVIGLHSIVDYPLRNMAIASLAGVAAGILLAPTVPAKSKDDGNHMVGES